MFARAGVLGILNVTPDSFSDGGRHATLDAQLARAFAIAAEGALALDVGGESTRPRGPYGAGASPVPLDEERARVLPVIEALTKRSFPIPISVDTRKAALAHEALERGASLINDVSAFGDPGMAGTIARAGAGVILMHMKGTPETMQADPHYDCVVGEIEAFLRERVAGAVAAGVARERILVDPGIGFGKSYAHSWTLLRATARFALLAPVVVGVSRKGLLGHLLDPKTPRPVDARADAGVGAALAAFALGARLVRTHDVRPTVDALRAFEAAGGLATIAPREST